MCEVALSFISQLFMCSFASPMFGAISKQKVKEFFTLLWIYINITHGSSCVLFLSLWSLFSIPGSNSVWLLRILWHSALISSNMVHMFVGPIEQINQLPSSNAMFLVFDRESRSKVIVEIGWFPTHETKPQCTSKPCRLVMSF